MASKRVVGFEVGRNYFIRTVTHHYTGKLVGLTPTELILVDAAWIPDDGRFADCIAKGTPEEVEPYPDGHAVIINRQALVDATAWAHELPRAQK